MELKQFYESAGGDAADTIKRLGGSEDMVRLFLRKFRADESFAGLVKSLDEGDTETAFRMAHTMKGIAANLGLQNLFDKASDVTEFLRAGNMEDAENAMPALREEYTRAVELIGELD